MARNLRHRPKTFTRSERLNSASGSPNLSNNREVGICPAA